MIEFLDTLFIVFTAFHVSVDGIYKNIDVHLFNGFLGAAVCIQDVDVESISTSIEEHFHLALMDEIWRVNSKLAFTKDCPKRFAVSWSTGRA